MWCCVALLTLLAATSGGASQLAEDEQLVYPEEQALYPLDVQITSSSQQLTVQEGDNVRLPCQWEGTVSDVVVLWKKLPSMILFTDVIKMSVDNRIKLGNNNELLIEGVKAEDNGTYVCALTLYPDPLELHHTVTVQRPAKLHPMDRDHFQVPEGDSFELVCQADGVPRPTVSWSKLGDDLVFLQEDSSRGVAFTIDRVEPHDTGTYTCTAQNGIGPPDVLTTRLEVVHAPHISVEQAVVRTARGLTAELACKVFANPRAETTWQKNGLDLPVSSRYETTVSRRFFSLKIRDVRDEDLGNYTCKAKNKHGRSEHHLTLTGLPGSPELRLSKPERTAAGSLSSRLSWELMSFSALEETVVTLVQLDPAGPEPREVRLPGVSSRSVAKSGQHQLTPLQENTTYQVQVEARNQYGWTPPTSLFFSISAGELILTQEPPRPAESTSGASTVGRLKLVPIMLIVSLSCFF
ncbi:protein amalgam-like isoform X2 [Pollicipes pollicipes]|uniref:protein amalgam-like isoform X2 n=1 Tax=Pollicipes pollicipes TaxID=41117 RepID=UPI001884BFD8|nr:protein amalgam-like isoform X2 [Pollicipes pollicipes]